MYLVFDLVYLNGEDLTKVPLVRRRGALKSLLPKDGLIRFSDAVEEHGIKLFALAKQQGLDGKGSLQVAVGNTLEHWCWEFMRTVICAM